MKIISICSPLSTADVLTVNYGMFFNYKKIDFKVINLTFSPATEELFKQFEIKFTTITPIKIGPTPSKKRYLFLFLKLIPYLPKLRKMIKSEKPDFIFINGFPSSFLVPLCLVGEKFKMIYFHHFIKQKESKIIRKVYLYLLKSYTLIIGVSSLVEKTLKNVFPELSKKIISFPNCIDLKKFDIKESKEEIRKKFNLPQDILGICIGRLTKFKNQAFLIDVANQIKREDFKIIIIGYGDEFENLKRKIEENNLEERVFLLGHKEWRNIPYYLKASDMFLYPSLGEGLPVVVIEAMASSLPIIIFKDIYVPDFGPHILVANNKKEFIELTRKLIMDEDFRKQKGEQNKIWAMNTFDIYKAGETLLRILYKLDGNKNDSTIF